MKIRIFKTQIRNVLKMYGILKICSKNVRIPNIRPSRSKTSRRVKMLKNKIS